MLNLNDVYDANRYFWPIEVSWTREGLDVIAHTIAKRVSRLLEKTGYLVRDANLSIWILYRTKRVPWERSSAPLSVIAWRSDPMQGVRR
jgi:hypothetical protein